MTDNLPTDSIAELRRLRMEVAEINDTPIEDLQLSNSRSSFNVEVLRELLAIRGEIADFKKAQGEINGGILKDFESIQKDLIDWKSGGDSAGNEISDRPIVEEVVGVGKHVENPQLSNSRSSLSVEVLKELRVIRGEIADFKKAQGDINGGILKDFESIQKDLIDLKTSRDLPGNETAPLCAQTNNTNALNRADVRKSLHIPSSLPVWQECSDDVGNHYRVTHFDVIAEFQTMIAAGIKILVYNGDVDTACNSIMNQQFLTSLNLTVLGEQEKVNEAWHYSGQTGTAVAGFQTKYTGNVDFLTVRGSGHFVPEDKPRESQQMIYNFINNLDYSTAMKN